MILERFLMQFHMDFNPAQKELNASKRCFERMVSAKNYEEYEEAWCDFLNRLEKSSRNSNEPVILIKKNSIPFFRKKMP